MSGQRLLAALSRVVLMATGMFSVWWGISTFPIFWHDARLEHTAYAITNGGQFKREVLQNLLADADLDKSWVRPEALRSAAIVRFGLVDQAIIAESRSPLAPSSINWKPPSGALCQPAAAARGYDIAVTGVERPEPRPWR